MPGRAIARCGALTALAALACGCGPARAPLPEPSHAPQTPPEAPLSAPRAEVEPPVRPPGPVVRVALASGVGSVRISCHGALELESAAQRMQPVLVTAGTWLTVTADAVGSLTVTAPSGAVGTFSPPLAIYPKEQGAIVWHGDRPYRGYFVVDAAGDGVRLLNRLGLEDYVRGVVANEIGGGSEGTLEALRAQTVAARTYAWAKLSEPGGSVLEPTEMDQVYRGARSETYWVNRAIWETWGEILERGGRVANTFYSSTCGGHTADPEEVWEGRGHPHLRARDDRNGSREHYCAGSRYYEWSVSWEPERLVEIAGRYYSHFYAKRGRPAGRLRDVRIVRRGPSGRVVRLEILTSEGRYPLDRDKIRWILRRDVEGEPALYSTLFDLDVARSGGVVHRVTARGHGHGHGVGMCQMGALEMSRRGIDYRQILRHYYEGVSLRRAY